MDLSSYKRDIDELIDEFARDGSTSFADMKRVWLSRKFSYIYEACPSTNLPFFMQSSFAHSIGYMLGGASLSHRLGGLYCLYCLYETQPFRPPFRVYLSLGELKKLKVLVVEAKEKGVKVVCALIKKMLERNMFLFGLLDMSDASIFERVNQLTELQNAQVQLAHKKLFSNTQIEEFLHMDMGMEIGSDMFKQMIDNYADAKKVAVEEACEEVDVQNIKHLAVDKEPIGDKMRKITEDWNTQKEIFYQQTRVNTQVAEDHEQRLLELQPAEDDEDLEYELEKHLFQM